VKGNDRLRWAPGLNIGYHSQHRLTLDYYVFFVLPIEAIHPEALHFHRDSM
jgi:hypothetical protein